MKQLTLSPLAMAITMGLILSACGSDGDASNPVPDQGIFSLGVSDNPADANIVNVAFKQVVLKNSDGAI